MMAPERSIKKCSEKAGMKPSDYELHEINEAFSSAAIALTRALELDPERINVNGGAVALGHPIGASGGIITTKLLYELKRTGGKYGLATMCIGGGQGIAAIFERL